MKHRHIDATNQQSKAYRDMWHVLYRATREERKTDKGLFSQVHFVDIVLMYVANYDVSPLVLRKMICLAGTICSDTQYPFLSLSELRRAELDDIASGIESVNFDSDEIPF